MTLDNPNFIKYGTINDKLTHMHRYEQNRPVQTQQQQSKQIASLMHKPERPKTLDTFSSSLHILKSSAVPITLLPNERTKQPIANDFTLPTVTAASTPTPANIDATQNPSKIVETNSHIECTFDEQEEWDKISEIMANFGTDDLSKTTFSSDKEKKQRTSNQNRFENGRSNSIAGYPTIDGNNTSIGSLQTSKSMSNSNASHSAPTNHDRFVEWLYTNGLEHLENILIDNGFDDIEFMKDVIDESDLELLEVQTDDRKKLLTAIDNHLQKPSRAISKFVKSTTTKSGVYSSFNTNEKNYVFNANNSDKLHSTKNNNYSTIPKQKSSDTNDTDGNATLTVDEWLDSIRLSQYSEIFRYKSFVIYFLFFYENFFFLFSLIFSFSVNIYIPTWNE